MIRFRSVGARLSLALAVVVLLALGIVYAIVVPTLERRLTDSRLDQLTRSAGLLSERFPSGSLDAGDFVVVDSWVQDAAVAANARVALLQPLSRTTAGPIADSGEDRRELARDAVALRTALTASTQRAVIRRSGARYAEVAFFVQSDLFGPTVLLFSAPLTDTLASVEVVKRRVLVAGAAALLVALLIGHGGARLFARRIRRLERAADQIAGGRLEEPVVDRGRDELGELARAFERMRGRLVQLDHARREFIANASHELRTPIFSLGGFLELLDEGVDEDTRREFVAAMREQVDRLTRLAGDLLDLSRLDAGRLHVDEEAVDLGDLAEMLAEEFAGVARAGAHPLAAHVEDGLPPALADELRVLRIGRVLVENALRHTPPGTPVAIRVRRDGDGLVLAVEDRGPGIPPEHRPHVFDRFYRVEGGIASGSGLGLAIARELASVMHGLVEVESRPGRTVFMLRLPVAEPAEGRSEPIAGARA